MTMIFKDQGSPMAIGNLVSKMVVLETRDCTNGFQRLKESDIIVILFHFWQIVLLSKIKVTDRLTCHQLENQI